MYIRLAEGDDMESGIDIHTENISIFGESREICQIRN